MKSSLKVISIVYIVIGILGIITGLVVTLGFSAIFTSDSQTTLAKLAFGSGILMVFSSLFGLIIGICGLKGSKGKKGSLNIGLVLSWVTVILSVVGIVVSVIARQTTGYHIIVSLTQIVMPILFIVFGRNVKRQINDNTI